MVNRRREEERGMKAVQFSRSVVSDSLRPHGLQHARPPCPSPTPGVYPNSCPLNWWCQSNISSLCCPLLFPPSILPSIRVFSNESVLRIRWPKYSSFTISPSMNNQHWFLLGLTGLISFLFKVLSSVFSNTIIQKHQFFCAQPSLRSKTHIHTWLLEKP